MKYRKKEQIVVILILAVAIASLSVGFAAFSTTLNISSSATINPSADNFKIKIYGLKEQYTDDEVGDNVSMDMLSDSISYGVEWTGNSYSDVTTTGTAIIDNNTHTIKEMNTHFAGAIVGEAKHKYYFVINNEGEYDAYIDMSTLKDGISHVCTSGENTTKEYVDEACKGVKFNFQIFKFDLENMEFDFLATDDDCPSYIQIEKGKSIAVIMEHYIGRYSNEINPETGTNYLPLPDGDWGVQFEDIKLTFSTVPPTND